MKSIIWNSSDEEFIEKAKVANNYTELAQMLGHFGTSGGTVAKRRAEKLGVPILRSTKVRISDEEFYARGTVRSTRSLRYRVLRDNFMSYECSECGMTHWLGKELSLQLDHIDGDASNNLRSNLRWLCPNCHSMTDTYAGRNRKSSRTKRTYGTSICTYCNKEYVKSYTKQQTCSRECACNARRRPPLVSQEELATLLKSHSFTEVGAMYNVSCNAVRKWCKKYGMPHHAKDYK